MSDKVENPIQDFEPCLDCGEDIFSEVHARDLFGAEPLNPPYVVTVRGKEWSAHPYRERDYTPEELAEYHSRPEFQK